jgi:hypothetical protein
MPGGYVVRVRRGQAFPLLYSHDSGSGAGQAKVPTTEETGRIAVNIARLPEVQWKAKRDRVSSAVQGSMSASIRGPSVALC